MHCNRSSYAPKEELAVLLKLVDYVFKHYGMNTLCMSSVFELTDFAANSSLTLEYARQCSAMKVALSGIEWNNGQKVPLQHPL